ncbi:MAG: leucine-rich repeat protein [Clostridia bacterium]|nr:leucine-rich repeat protein [Clostridia bacterium]
MYRRFLFIIVCIFMLATVVSAQETVPESLTSTPRPSEAMLFAQHSDRDKELAAEIYQNFLKADPEIFLLTEEGQKNIQWVEWEIPATDEEYAFVKSKAEEITAGLETDAEKIRAVAEYTALNVCYDYDYYEHGTKLYSELALTPYKILTEKNTVCEGYSRLCEALLQAIDIPCIYVFSPDHSWNMAWDGTRWILFDSTWMSNCTLEYGKYKYSTKLNKEWYDFTFEEALDEYNHLILELPYTVKDGVLTKYPIMSSDEAIRIYEGVTEIKENLFINAPQRILYLPKSLTRLNDDVFYYSGYYNYIEKVYIDDIRAWLKINFESSWANPLHCGVDAELFVDGKKLTNLVIPGDITDFGYALVGCASLETVTLHEGMTEIRYLSFYGCTNLRSINIPEGVTAIGDQAFGYCESLTDIDIPDTVKSIGRNAFYGCESLISINIPDGITYIDWQTFDCCTGLEEIRLPGSITSIGGYAFGECSALSRVYIDNIGDWLNIDFYNTSANPLCNGAELYVGGEKLTELVIPGDITDFGIALAGCEGLESVTLHGGITEIGEYCFSGCTDLRNINIHEGITSVGESAFSYCESLTKIDIPDTVRSIGEKAFYGCTNLAEITLPEGFKDIANGMLAKCTSLKSIALPEKLISIGDGAFSGCTALAEISIPDTVTSIGTQAFYNCTSLAKISLPSGVTAVPEAIFRGCTALSDVVLHNGITSIGKDAFYGCSSLDGIILPNTLETIGSYAFYKCTSLTEITVPEGLISIGSSALSRAAIKTVNYASDEEAWRAIDNSSSLKNIQLNCNVIAVNSATAKTKEINANGTFTSAITGLPEGITAEELEGLLVCSSNWEIVVYDNGGEKTASDAVIATGFRICFTSADGNVQREFLLSVYGDVNGDGIVNALDVTDTLSHIAGGKRAAYGFAVDKSSDGVITMDELNSFISVFR